MTFSAQVKQELCTHIIEKPCCARAFCWGAAGFSHTFTLDKLEFHTESEQLARYLRTMFATQGIRLQPSSYRVHGHEKLILSTGTDGRAQLAAFIAGSGADHPEALLQNYSLLEKQLRCPSCQSAFLTGAFLCGGIIANPQKEYHLEFVSQQPARLHTLANLLMQEGLEPRYIRKNANEVLYLSASEQIEDLLTGMGAARFAMEIMNEKIYKNYRNQVNRITNCENANIDKTVEANQKAIAAITLLQQSGVMGTLPQPLQDAAAARLADPAATLAELAASMQPPVSKSGLAHRFKKLIDTADKLQKRLAETALS